MIGTRGTAAGVPYVALPPADGAESAPLVVVWHLAGSPRSETAMAAALPLRGLQAWRVYLGLPMLGSRLPEGGLDGFFRLFREDIVLNVFQPVVRAAVEELPAARGRRAPGLRRPRRRAGRTGCATLLVVGADDDEEGFGQPAEELRAALSRRSPGRAGRRWWIPAMVHALAEEPGHEPAPQTAHAARTDAAVVDWLRRHLAAT